MFKTLLCAVILSLSISTLFAQYRFEIGVEGGPINCYYQIKEPLKNLKNVPCVSGFGGATIRFTRSKEYFFETGVLFSEYTVGLKLKQQTGIVTGNHDAVMFIPFRIGHIFDLSKRFSIVPSAGITTTIKTMSQDGSYTTYTEGTPGGLSSYEYRFRENSNKVYALANGNIAAEYQFYKQFKFTAGAGYYPGVSKNNTADIQYTVPSAPPQSGQLISRGSFLAYTFSVKYMMK